MGCPNCSGGYHGGRCFDMVDISDEELKNDRRIKRILAATNKKVSRRSKYYPQCTCMTNKKLNWRDKINLWCTRSEYSWDALDAPWYLHHACNLCHLPRGKHKRPTPKERKKLIKEDIICDWKKEKKHV